MTLYDRIQRWSVYSVDGSSDFFGGQKLQSFFKEKVPLKCIISCYLAMVIVVFVPCVVLMHFRSMEAWFLVHLNSTLRIQKWHLAGQVGTSYHVVKLGFIEAMRFRPYCYSISTGTCVQSAQGTDSLPTNIAIAALEQRKFVDEDLGRTGLTLLYSLCLHHQACLCKKPLILKLSGLATGAASYQLPQIWFAGIWCFANP